MSNRCRGRFLPPFTWIDCDLGRFFLAKNIECDRLSGARMPNLTAQLLGSADGMAVHRGDNVARMKVGFCGRPVGEDGIDDDAISDALDDAAELGIISKALNFYAEPDP